MSSRVPSHLNRAALALVLVLLPGAAFAQPALPKAPVPGAEGAAKPDAGKPDAAKPDAPPNKPETVLATVNGKAITQRDLDVAGDDLGPNLPGQLAGKARDAYVLDYLIDGTLVAQKAQAEKADQAPGFADKLAYAKEKLLMEAVLAGIAKTAANDAALHKIYDDAAKAQEPEEEIQARHILVATEGDAQAALKRLKGGEDFAKVAKDMSKDPGSEGGELGWFTKDRMVPAFADAAFKLQKDQISDPVKTQFGWHVIQLEGRRQKTFPPFEQVRDQITRYAVQKGQSDLIVDLRKGAKIERTAAAPPAAPPALATPDADASPAK